MKIFCTNLIKNSYNREVTHLRDYLNSGPDPWDYSVEVERFLEEKGIEVGDDFEGYEWIEENEGSPNIIEFKEWLEENDVNSGWETDAPAYEAMRYNRFIEPQWLIHWTNDAYSISREGFKYGHDDFRGLGHTTHKMNRQEGSGYNFAFPLSRWAKYGKGKYGNEFVVFWGTGIEVSHFGDEEHQVIIWGPSVSKDMIFPVYNGDGGDWEVRDERNDDRILFQGEDVLEVAGWIENNYRMLQNIRKKASSWKRTISSMYEEDHEDHEEDYEEDGYSEELPRGGDCYEAAGKLLMDSNLMGFSTNDNCILVHADITPRMGPLSGITHGHAWVEKGDIVLDYSNGRNLELPRDLYYGVGDPKNIKKYNYKEMARKITDNGHWGPWE